MTQIVPIVSATVDWRFYELQVRFNARANIFSSVSFIFETAKHKIINWCKIYFLLNVTEPIKMKLNDALTLITRSILIHKLRLLGKSNNTFNV